MKELVKIGLEEWIGYMFLSFMNLFPVCNKVKMSV